MEKITDGQFNTEDVLGGVIYDGTVRFFSEVSWNGKKVSWWSVERQQDIRLEVQNLQVLN